MASGTGTFLRLSAADQTFAIDGSGELFAGDVNYIDVKKAAEAIRFFTLRSKCLDGAGRKFDCGDPFISGDFVNRNGF